MLEQIDLADQQFAGSFLLLVDLVTSNGLLDLLLKLRVLSLPLGRDFLSEVLVVELKLADRL